MGCALPGYFRIIGCTSLLCNRCGLRAVFVASDSPGFSFPLQCARRCRPRIAAIAAHVPRPSLLCCGLRAVFVVFDRPSILFPLRRARRYGLRVVFIASANPSISFALPCYIRLPKTFVALQCIIFFFYRLICFL